MVSIARHCSPVTEANHKTCKKFLTPYAGHEMQMNQVIEKHKHMTDIRPHQVIYLSYGHTAFESWKIEIK